MDRIEALSNMIQGGMSLSGWIAQEIASMPLEPKKENLHLASLCLSHYKDLSRVIYKDRPDLMPHYLREDAKEDSNTEIYGPDNPLPEEAVSYLEVTSAIDMLKIFSSYGKNKVLREIAEREILKLEDTIKT